MYNRITLIGNLTRDPELRYTEDGIALVKFGLAVNNRRNVNEVLFVDVTVWNKQAESCASYLTKGRQVLVEGRLRLHSWQDQEGNRRSRHEVVADMVQFMGGRNGDSESNGNRANEPVAAGTKDDDDDLPF